MALAYRAPDGFDERVRQELAAKWPKFEFKLAEPGAIDVYANGERAAQIGLTSLAQQVLQDPPREAELIKAHLDQIPIWQLERLAAGEAAMEAPSPEMLFPRLVPTARFDGIDDERRPALRPFHGAVSLSIVAQYPYGERYLAPKDLDELGLDWDRALATAIENLELLLRKSRIEGRPGADGKPELLVIEGHPHAAAAILLPSFPIVMGRAFGKDFYVCIPGIDELVAFRAEPRAFVDEIVATAWRSFAENAYPVSDQVFKIGDAGPVPVELGSGDGAAGGPKIWLPGRN